ncbi:MAG: hypothetical protein D8M58_08555 [Calditrichaeota bacterium]|nr:MAG: hypothetical protein DWQ03_17935 [Calditrichota bacterium]MBL1205433.1 hypothetical protein [Calditrichota bacterium]NOG45262.1 hypothetical protein [Calditrichota bacterium]
MKPLILFLFLLSQISFAQVIHQISFDRFSHYDADDWITYAYSNHITSIDIGSENIYFGTSHGGILRYNFFDEEWLYPQTTSNGLHSNRIKRVVFDTATNQLFALTPKGVQVFNKAFEYWQNAGPELPARTINRPTENPGNTRFPALSRPILSSWPNFIVDDNYELMLDGLIYNPDNEEYRVGERIVDRWYKMWIATNGTGIGLADFDMVELKFIKQSTPAIHTKDVLVTADNIWVAGTPFKEKERGIARWNFEDDSWDYFKSGINFNIFSDDIRVIENIGSQIFFGTEQGLLQYNSKRDEWISLQKANPLKNDVIYDLDHLDGLLYIASENGAFKYDYKMLNMENVGKKFLHQTKVNKITNTSNNVYLATDRGIFEYNPQKDKTSLLDSHAAIADNFIDAIGANNDTLWFASQKGIGFYDITNGDWKSFPATNFRLNSKINDITFSDWYVWFATNKGLLKYDKERDYWYLYTKKDGLADNRVFNIDVDGDHLWLSTFKGVTLFRWYREGRFE